jgi:hypothetical protein
MAEPQHDQARRGKQARNMDAGMVAGLRRAGGMRGRLKARLKGRVCVCPDPQASRID